MLLCAALLTAAGCSSSTTARSPSASGGASSSQSGGESSTRSGHHHHHKEPRPKKRRQQRPANHRPQQIAGIPAVDLPRRALTQGVAFPVGRAQISLSYSSPVRDVPASEFDAVYARYGIQHVPYAHEVDHLISLEVGGSNSIRDLWPERRPMGRPHQGRSREQAPRSDLQRSARTAQSPAPRGDELGRRI
jgi:hypothetical protein